MIQDHVLPGPITGIPLAFTNPKQSLLPTRTAPRHDSAVSLVCFDEQYTHIHPDHLVNLFFL